jgi:hypothetical protein
MLREDKFCSSNPRRIYLGIHRSHTVVGQAVGNLMNMGTTLAVYASICKEKELLSFGQDQKHSGMAYLMVMQNTSQTLYFGQQLHQLKI